MNFFTMSVGKGYSKILTFLTAGMWLTNKILFLEDIEATKKILSF